eukprot:g14266.t1
MFLLLNILLAIILDAFEKNQDDRRQIDEPFVELVVVRPIRYVTKKLLHCFNKNKKKQLDANVDKNMQILHDERLKAANIVESKGLSKKVLFSKEAELLYQMERRKSIDEGIPNEPLENILNNIKFDYDGMKENLQKIVGENQEEVETATNLLFKAYGKDDNQRTAFEYQLQEIQSHVTRSLKKTDAKLEETKSQLELKLDLILKH